MMRLLKSIGSILLPAIFIIVLVLVVLCGLAGAVLVATADLSKTPQQLDSPHVVPEK